MFEPHQQVVTIDGPAGVGKSTVSQGLAHRLGFTYLDTGAMYRAFAYGCIQQGVDITDVVYVEEIIKYFTLHLETTVNTNTTLVYLNDKEISNYIRTSEIASAASRISAYKGVRDKLTWHQQEIGRQGKLVAEGRDTGTVVFPKAAWKFFLDATPETRAKRRYLQLENQGLQADQKEILNLILERDKADRERIIAPLKAAEDALTIDSSNMTAEKVIEEMVARIKG